MTKTSETSMIPEALVEDVRGIRAAFLSAVESLNNTSSFQSLLGDPALRADWDTIQNIADSPRIRRPVDPTFTCAVVGSSSHGKTSILREMFPTLAARGWLVTDVTDTTSQALTIRRGGPAGSPENDEAVVHSWDLPQIRRLVNAAEKDNERLGIRVKFHADNIEIDGSNATFAPLEKQQFRFGSRQVLRPLPHPYSLKTDERGDPTLIRAITVKESSNLVQTAPVLSVSGQSFNALQLRAAVKAVEIRDTFERILAWSGSGGDAASGLVFVDTPGLNVAGSEKDEVLRAVLGRKNQQIIVELLRDDELDLIAHLVLAGQQSSFAQLWGPLNGECDPRDLADLGDRLVLVINGMNIFFRNADIKQRWENEGVAKRIGDQFMVTIENNVLQRMTEVSGFRPARICFVDSKRIVESESAGRGYAEVYAGFRPRLEQWSRPGGVGYETLTRLGLVNSFRENVAALCDPDDCGQGFVVRQILGLIRDRGPRLFVRKYVVRSRLRDAIRKAQDALGRYYDKDGRLDNWQALRQAVDVCLPTVRADDLNSIEEFFEANLASHIRALALGPQPGADPSHWVDDAYRQVLQILYNACQIRSLAPALREPFTKLLQSLGREWREKWGYKSAKLPPPTPQHGASADLLRRALLLHAREMLYQLVTGGGGGPAAGVVQTDDDRQAIQVALEQLTAAGRRAASVCHKYEADDK